MKKIILGILSLVTVLTLLMGATLPAAAEAKPIDPYSLDFHVTPTQGDAFELVNIVGFDKDNWNQKLYGPYKAGSNSKYYLSDIALALMASDPENYKGEIVTKDEDGGYTIKQTGFKKSGNTVKTFPDAESATGSSYFEQYTTINYCYATTSDPLVVGSNNYTFEKGLGMHPKDPKSFTATDPKYEVYQPHGYRSWIEMDISEYTAEGSTTPADTFYSVVGITNANNTIGVVFWVYGDSTGNGNFELLARSDKLIGKQLGEFNVDISGIKTLRLEVSGPKGASTHASSACTWADACLFLEASNTTKPNYTADYVPVDNNDDEDLIPRKDYSTMYEDDEGEDNKNDQAPADTTPAEPEGGCKNSVTVGTVGVLAVAGAVTAIGARKRRRR